jgi:hypothetical protein
LTGTLVAAWATPATVTWVGIRGSDIFAQAAMPGSASERLFFLSAPSPAAYPLTVVYGSQGALYDPDPDTRDLDMGLEVQPRELQDLGNIPLPPPPQKK